MMKNRIRIGLACLAILSAAIIAEAMVPRTSMAKAADTLDLEKIIPTNFGKWSRVPGIRLVEPPGDDTLSHEIYNQELSRGYSDGEGHVVMLLIAYGVSQSDRLQLHRPEICYAAQGFTVSRRSGASLAVQPSQPPLRLTRLVTRREERFEPVTYWMRIGNDVATGVVERQILKVGYGLRGWIPDGALIRVSTIGIPEDAAFALQARFVQDLVGSLTPTAQRFVVGDSSRALVPTM